jgi:LmbE family N-acetylglucosaminyl deacetylase
MLGWMPSPGEDRPLGILCLGAHSDDIEIGCGGTILQLADSNREFEVRFRAQEARKSAEYWLSGMNRKEIRLHDFRDGFFPDEWSRIKDVFEEIKGAFEPDLILTHRSGDMHQDHRIICELTWNTFRNHSILEYEIPKYDGDLNTPSVYLPVSAEAAQRKAGALLNYFSSQSNKHWFCEELFLGLMRLRGMECCAPSGYAEGFHSRKLSLSI